MYVYRGVDPFLVGRGRDEVVVGSWVGQNRSVGFCDLGQCFSGGGGSKDMAF